MIEDILNKARGANAHVVLSEGEDPRVVEAGLRARAEGIARITLVGRPDIIGDLGGVDGIYVADPMTSDKTDGYAEAYFQLRQHKGMSEDAALANVQNPLGFAAMMVRQGDADGTLGGAVATTADVVRTALQIIGRAKGVDVVSSYFLMLLKSPFDRPVVFSDCGLILQPTAEELASIAIASSESLTALTGLEPKVAMLSFSTKGSVPVRAHESLERIQDAMDILAERAPDLVVDGELQFDAALVPDVASKKAPESSIAGAANVLVFPSLSAGNIGYKIAQRLGGAVALGPILQGLKRPANDLSRGATADDIYQMIAITSAQTANSAT